MTHSLDPAHAVEYRRRASLSIGLGLGSIPALVAGLIDPARLGSASAAAAQSGGVVRVWLAAYLFGCVAAAGGALWRPKPLPDIEASGCVLLIFAFIINALAILWTRGYTGGGYTAVSLFGLAWVFWRRWSDLRHASQREQRLERRVRDDGLGGRR